MAIKTKLKSNILCDIMCDLDQCDKVKQLEIQLAEAQQWIDSEPDWKNQYMKRYMILQDDNKRLQVIVDSISEASDKGAVTPGFWGRVAARQAIKARKLEENLSYYKERACCDPDNKWGHNSLCLRAKIQKLEKLELTLREICLHQKTQFEDWPDGGVIETCDDCGMSRYQWEQGESPWIMVEDIPKVREEVKKVLEGLAEEIHKHPFIPGGKV